MSPHLSRRAFLAGTLGAAFLAACGDDESDRPAVSVPPDTGPDGEEVSLLVSSNPILAGLPEQRVALLAFQGDREPVAAGTRLAVAFGPQGGRPSQPVEAVRHSEGLDQAYYLVTTQFPSAGVWGVVAQLDDGRTTQAAIEVKEPGSLASPTPGEPMVSVPTATVADPRGVDPICTRDPQCRWHEVSLDQALQQSRPLAVLFGTPALCRTATCGPVLEVLLEEGRAFEDRVQFIHVEIFTDLSGKTTTQPLQAYQLESEPALFLAGADGTVRRRIGGIFDRTEIRDRLDQLVA